MKLTQALLGEHGVFYAQFKHLEQTLWTAASVSELQAQAALLKAALETHAHLEDALLFKALDPHLGPVGPLAVMRTEHDNIEDLLAQLPHVQHLSQAQETLQRLIQIARQHFAKEERVLFLLAEQTLGPVVLHDLGAQWAEQREVVVQESI